MGKFSQLISDRYEIELTPQWTDWFDYAAHQLGHPGCFRQPVDIAGLCQVKPTQIWGGFMLPDTLPIMSNGYGDWICVRVGNDNRLAELIHWYHGGGDWIPVGSCVAEAVLHDAVDLNRPVRKQMLRGAVESIRSQESQAFSANWSDWMHEALASKISNEQVDQLPALLQATRSGNYSEALELMSQLGIAPEAVACDQIERLIHVSIPSEQAALNMLDDADRARLATHCQNILARRDDLGWCHALLGLIEHLNGQKFNALQNYFAGRFASAFSDQSVRLRLHRFEKRFGKYSIAQLAANKNYLSEAMLEDDYLKLFITSSTNLVDRVQEYWLTKAAAAIDAGDFDEAYSASYRAGWDLGAASLSGYRKILERLHDAAFRAGWQARAAVALSHLNCL
jgi:hypothetical protein